MHLNLMNKIKVDITKEFIKVVLEYYNNVYLAENKIFKHMPADALRMFDMNGYLVGVSLLRLILCEC